MNLVVDLFQMQQKNKNINKFMEHLDVLERVNAEKPIRTSFRSTRYLLPALLFNKFTRPFGRDHFPLRIQRAFTACFASQSASTLSTRQTVDA